MNMKTKIGTVLGVGFIAAGLAWSWNEGSQIEARIAERKANAVVRYAYDAAQGNDVYLSGGSTGNVYLEVGTLKDRDFVGPRIYAVDENIDGRIDRYSIWNVSDNCKGDKDYKQYDENMLLTALGKSTVCDREVALLRFANTETLSKIEQELLPYYGQETY